jgi:hypothetical protein
MNPFSIATPADADLWSLSDLDMNPSASLSFSLRLYLKTLSCARLPVGRDADERCVC